MNKQAIYDEARALLVDWYGAALAEQGACLYWTQVTMRTLAAHGERPVLQAGDMLWPVVEPHADDGARPTHFGYQWSPEEPFSQDALARGELPEVHIWCALPDRGEIVDFSTGSFKRLCRERHGLPWETEDPPLYLWAKEPPPLVLYQPVVEAVRFVWGFILAKQFGNVVKAEAAR